MTTLTLDKYFRGVLDIDGLSGIDISLNGLQVDNDGSPVKKIAFAVDACMESFQRAIHCGADMLYVHHGLFWGSPVPVTAIMRSRIKFLLDHNLALYATHLPLDQHPAVGNNAAMAAMLGIENPEPFGLWRGVKVGYKGRLKEPLTVDAALTRIQYQGSPPLGVYRFGKELNSTCAVITGAGASEAEQAMAEGMDLYVTGEMSHEIYHPIAEGKLNMICGGHYATEVWGLKKLMEVCAGNLEADLEFIDVPTGL